MAYYKNVNGAVELDATQTLDRARDYERSRFDRRPATRRLDRWEKRIVSHLLETYGRGRHVLDVPCGSGRFFDICKQAGELTMIDLSEGMLAVAKERSEGHAHVKAIQADVTNLPLPDDSVDLVVCMRLFHHFPNDEIRSAAMKELARVSRGHIGFSFYNRASWKYWRRALLGREVKINYNSVQHMVDLARPHGLKLVERLPSINIVQPQCVLVFATT